MTMPRPRDPNRKRLSSTRFRDGYAVLIGGVWYLRHGVAKKSTGLRDAPGNDRRVIRLLDEWVEQRLYPQPVEVEVARGTVVELVSRFVAARYPGMSASSRQGYDSAVALVFPHDMPLEYGALVDHLSTTKGKLARPKSEGGRSPATASVYLTRVKTILQYAVERGDLPRNPMAVVGVPQMQLREEIPTYSPSEIESIVGALQDDRARLLIRLLSLTALRSFEALALDSTAVTSTSLRIVGKGSARRKAPVRHIPLNPLGMPPGPRRESDWASPLEMFYGELWAVLGDLLALGDGPWFPMSYETYKAWLIRAKKQLGMIDSRRLHTFRATAEERWESLGFDPFTITDQAGHSLEMYLKRYRKRKSVEKTSERIRALAR